MKQSAKNSPELERLDDTRVRIAPHGNMNVPGIVYASPAMIEDILLDPSLQQVANVAHLPGIVAHSLAMPDIHAGYGFPIGGVAAFDPHDGVVSPGGVGYDINCGVRMLRTSIPRSSIEPHLQSLADLLLHRIPSGVGSKSHLVLSDSQLDEVMVDGAAWAVAQGYGTADDLACTEEGGCMDGATPTSVSERARQRGKPQLGSLGSGNHFCEVGWVAEIYNDNVASAFGLHQGDVTVMLHTGSRGFGYQICDDYLPEMYKASQRYGIQLPDRQLCAAPLNSPEAHRYLGAMACAINFAFANRQMLTHFVRQAFRQLLNDPNMQMPLVYDLCHNIAKWERHNVDGKQKRLCVHRKGATRAFAAGHPDVPAAYRHVGQPVLVPGDMGRYSYVLVGTEQAMEQTWGSVCHGAGRRMSRKAAMQAAKKRKIVEELRHKGVWVQATSRRTVAEEIPEAYKDVAEVVRVVEKAGLAKKVARLEPLAVVKG